MPGTDYRVLTGGELNQFKAEVFKGTGSVPLGNRGLVLLFESGLHLALVKTQKEAGRKLRRFLADRVLPQLVRTGRYVADEAPKPTKEHARERRLQQQADAQCRRVAVLEREAHARALREMGRSLFALGHLDDVSLAGLEVQAAEVVTGLDLNHLKPVAPKSWLTATEIGKQLGITSYRVGRLITQLELRGDIEGLSRAYSYRPPHMDRDVICHAYSPEAVRRIETAAAVGE